MPKITEPRAPTQFFMVIHHAFCRSMSVSRGPEKRLVRGPPQVAQMLVGGKKKGPSGAKTASRVGSLGKDARCREAHTLSPSSYLFLNQRCACRPHLHSAVTENGFPISLVDKKSRRWQLACSLPNPPNPFKGWADAVRPGVLCASQRSALLRTRDSHGPSELC